MKTVTRTTVDQLVFISMLSVSVLLLPTVSLTTNAADTTTSATEKETDNNTQKTTLLGKTKVTEYRHLSGQVYQFKLEHSARNIQYIEETDSDGNIGYTENGIEKTPNLPKWKIGSW